VESSRAPANAGLLVVLTASKTQNVGDPSSAERGATASPQAPSARCTGHGKAAGAVSHVRSDGGQYARALEEEGAGASDVG